MTSPASERYGRRPRFATFTAIRPPGSRTRTHSAKTSRSIVEVVEVVAGMWPSPSASSYSLPAKYGGEVTTSATELDSTADMSRESPTMMRPAAVHGLTTSSSEIVGGVNRS